MADVLCHTERVWHEATRVPPVVTGPMETPPGTHGGRMGERPRQRLSDEARLTRRAKNARNYGRRGKDTRPRGSQRRG